MIGKISRDYRSFGLLIAAATLVIVLSGQQADAGSCCSTCDPCHCVSCLGCATYVLTAISGCCGMGDGNAQCSGYLGPGFAVACEGGKNCVCDADGENCDPLEGEP